MGREQCQMCEVWRGEIYCGYYDFLTHVCAEIDECPDGLDNEDDYDEYIPDDDEITNSDVEYY